MVNATKAELIQIRPWKFTSREVPSWWHGSSAGLSWFTCNHQDQRLRWLLIRSRCAPSWSGGHRNRRCHWCLGYHCWCLRSIGRCSRIIRGISWHSIHRCRRWCHRRCCWWCNRWWCNRWWWYRWESRWESSSCCLFPRQRCRLKGCCQLFEAIIDSLNHLFIAFTELSMDWLQSLFGRRRSGQKFVGNGFDTGVGLLFGASNLPFQVLEWTEYLLKLGQLIFGSNFVAVHFLC